MTYIVNLTGSLVMTYIYKRKRNDTCGNDSYIDTLNISINFHDKKPFIDKLLCKIQNYLFLLILAQNLILDSPVRWFKKIFLAKISLSFYDT